MYAIDKLDKVWIEAELYSGEAKLVKKGDKVQVAVAGFENEPVVGKVSFISPEFKNNTQLFIVRVEIPNSDLNFLPGMQANVLLSHSEKRSIAVPIDAVVRSGAGTHVWVTAGGSTFVPKLVVTGVENANQIEIVEGLDNNDTVVTTGAYLLYSEYLLKKGGNIMAELKNQVNDTKQIQEGDSQIEIKQFQVESKFKKQLQQVFHQYIVLKEALVASNPVKAKTASLSVMNTVESSKFKTIER